MHVTCRIYIVLMPSALWFYFRKSSWIVDAFYEELWFWWRCLCKNRVFWLTRSYYIETNSSTIGMRPARVGRRVNHCLVWFVDDWGVVLFFYEPHRTQQLHISVLHIEYQMLPIRLLLLWCQKGQSMK